MKKEAATDPRMREVVVGKNGVRRPDRVAVEEPLEIRLVHCREGEWVETTLSITMRTPGNDYELAVGFLLGEGILQGRGDLRSLKPLLPERPGCNTVRVALAETTKFDSDDLQRHFYMTSSCGVCGKASLEAIREIQNPRLQAGSPRIASETIPGLPLRLRQSQTIFKDTGGLHAAAIFTPEGNLECLREDVGRHNAVDKVIGRMLLDGRTPLSDSILMVSGRTSFEILQKALAARIPVVAAVSAPSSLAVDVAREFGLTLLGFVRGRDFNIYSGGDRLY